MMRSKYLLRILFDVGLFVGVFFVPWWLVFGIAIMLVFLFDYFIEVILLASILDILFSPFPHMFSTQSFLFTLIATGVYLVSPFLKKMLRFYNQ